VKHNEKFSAIRRMPPLRHTQADGTFSLDKSEVVKWLLEQDCIRQFVFDKAKDREEIVYHEASGLWCGRDWKE